jgi:tetratricopeptide (TPR) repeat protein
MTARADRLRLAVCGLAMTLAACEGTLPRHVVESTEATPAASSAPSPAEVATPSRPVEAAAPADADKRFQAALKLMKDKQYPQATAAFTALAKDNPNLSGPLTNLGIIYAQTKKRDAAIDSFSRAVAASPDNAVAYNWLGTLYRESGNFAGAESAYKKALAAHGDYAYAHYNLAILYDQYLNRPQDALEQYRAYLKHSGTDDLKVQTWMKALELKISAPAAANAQKGSAK